MTAPAPTADDFRPTTLDLLLATAVALGLPPAAAWLWERTGGALAGLLLYYAVCCVAIVRWRRGSLGYRRPARWPWAIFLPSLLLPLASFAVNLWTLPDAAAPTGGLLATLLLWAPLNGATEQLAWFYVLDAWRLRWRDGWPRWVGLAVGVGLTLALIALIHIRFWVNVLPVATGPNPLGAAGAALPMLLTLSYALLWLRSGSMWPVFVLHTLVDAQLVLAARYSILPHL